MVFRSPSENQQSERIYKKDFSTAYAEMKNEEMKMKRENPKQEHDLYRERMSRELILEKKRLLHQENPSKKKNFSGCKVQFFHWFNEI